MGQQKYMWLLKDKRHFMYKSRGSNCSTTSMHQFLKYNLLCKQDLPSYHPMDYKVCIEWTGWSHANLWKTKRFWQMCYWKMSKQRILENKNISRSCPTSRSSHERISVLKKKKNVVTSFKMKQIQMAVSHTNGLPEWF